MPGERMTLAPRRPRRGLGDRLRGLAEALPLRSEPKTGYSRSTQVPVRVAAQNRLERMTRSQHSEILQERTI